MEKLFVETKHPVSLTEILSQQSVVSLFAKSTKQSASLHRCIDLVQIHHRRNPSGSVPACPGDWGTGTHWRPAGNGIVVTPWHMDFGSCLSFKLWYGFFERASKFYFAFYPSLGSIRPSQSEKPIFHLALLVMLIMNHRLTSD